MLPYSDVRILFLRSTFLAILFCMASYAAAFQRQDDVEQRGLQQLIRETESSLATKNWLEAVEKFDAAWAMACEKEDPLMVVTGADVRQLAPGETQSLAGGKAKLEALFQQSPELFRKEFAQQFSEVAENEVAASVKAGDLAALRRTSIRHAFSPAAQKGLAVLAKLSVDRGDDLEAALLVSRLQRSRISADPALWIQIALFYSRAGLHADALDLVNRVVAEAKVESLVLAGQKIDLPVSKSETAAWIEENFGKSEASDSGWLQPGGGYRRFANQSRSPARYRTLWKSSLFSVRDVLYAEQYNPLLSDFSETIEQEASRLLRRNSTVIPTATPLISGDLAIIRTPFGIRALKISTGELIWEVTRPDSQLRLLLDERLLAGNEPDAARRQMARRRFRGYMDPRIQLLYQQIRTNTASQMAINDRTLFVCDESSAATWSDDIGYNPGGDPNSSMPSNFIRAYDAVSGLFKWEVGGQTQNAAQPAGRGNLLAGYYFLGSPLVLGSRTYVLAENGEGIFLIQIGEPNGVANDSNPQILSSQLLTVPQVKLPLHPVRKHAGMVPSFAQGLLICPTCDERIIAVSAEDHSVRWVFRYAGNARAQEIGGDGIVLFGGRDPMDTRRVDMDSRWIDSLPRILDNKVLVTPRDSDQLYCLDLISGKELWTFPRGGFHAIGAVVDDRIVLVGNQRCAAVRVSDGTVLWSTELTDGVVCGTATTDGSIIQIPTDEPSIISLDLENGRRLARQFGDLEKMPGNLLITDSGVLSQNLTSVAFLPQVSNGGEPAVADLAMELLLDRKPAEAMSLLDAASEAGPIDGPSRELLIDMLLEILRNDFAKNRALVPRVRSLIELSANDLEIAPLLHSMLGMNLPDAAVFSMQTQGRSERYHGKLSELVARGIETMATASAGELTDSLRTLLGELPAARRQAVTSGFLVRTKATVLQAGIRNALVSRPESERHQIQEALRGTAVDVLRTLDAGEPRVEFLCGLAQCGLSEVALAAMLELAKETPDPLDALFAEMLRIEISRTSSVGAAKASVELLESWQANGDQSAISTWIADVATPLDPRTSLRMRLVDEATRETFLEALKQQPEVTHKANSAWLKTPFKRESDERTMLGTIPVPDLVPSTLIPLYGAPGLYRGWSFARILNSGDLCGFDPDGVIRWTLKSLGGPEDSRYGFAAASYITAYGHLLVVNLNGSLLALDPTQLNKAAEPKVLWRKNIERLAPDAEADLYRDYVSPTDRLPQYFPQPAGYFPVGPTSLYGVPVISGLRLLVLNPLTGNRMWQVESIARDSVMLCQDDSVLLLSEASRQIEVRSLVDGSVRSVVRLPEWWGEANANVGSSVRDIELEAGVDTLWRILLHGNSCLLFRLTTGKAMLESRNLLTDTVTWSIDLPQETVFSNVIDDAVALLSNGSQLKLVQVDTGRVLSDLAVTRVTEPRDLFLRESHGHYLVLPEAVDDASLDYDPVIDAMHVYGRIYSIAKETYTLAWDKELDHRHIKVMIPDRATILPNAPILVLLSRGGSVNAQSPIRRTHYGARVFDVRTGDLLYEEEDVGTTLNNHWLRVDANAQKLDLSFDRRVITLDYSGNETRKAK